MNCSKPAASNMPLAHRTEGIQRVLSDQFIKIMLLSMWLNYLEEQNSFASTCAWSKPIL